MGDLLAALTDPAAERAVIGMLLLDGEKLWRTPLAERHFTDWRTLAALRAVVELATRGAEINIVTVHAWLKDAGDRVPFDYLAECVEQAAATPLHVAAVLEACERRRQIHRAADQLRAIALGPGHDAAAGARDVVDALLAAFLPGDNVQMIELPTAARALLADDRDQGADAVLTGFPDVDGKVGGMPRGELTVLASRPGMGKSSLAHQIAVRVGRAGGRVLLVTPEMSNAQVTARILAWSGEVPLARIRAGMSANERDRLRARAGELPTSVWLFDKGTQTTADIAAMAGRYRAQYGGLDLVLVDHLQYLADRTDRNETRATVVGRMSKSLKQLARACDAAVMLLSQLNRECEQRSDKRPELRDLRESGDIEQDADLVWLLFRPGYYDDAADQQAAELIVAKARNGARGVIPLRWHGSTTSFSDELETPFPASDRYRKSEGAR